MTTSTGIANAGSTAFNTSFSPADVSTAPSPSSPVPHPRRERPHIPKKVWYTSAMFPGRSLWTVARRGEQVKGRAEHIHRTPTTHGVGVGAQSADEEWGMGGEEQRVV